jgi:hypothetical protein
VPGGQSNAAAGQYTLAAGRRAKANHDGAFVWADSTDADFGSTAADEFSVRSTGGVRLFVDTAGSGLRIKADATSPNLIGGHSGNSVTSGVHGATIGGGGSPSDEGTPAPNRITDDCGTIGGGLGNQAGDDAGTTSDKDCATVGGGLWNTASHIAATVAGGDSNTASGDGAAVGGGVDNTASGDASAVNGGDTNTATATGAAVGGGTGNDATGSRATVGGGNNNTSGGLYATVGGGNGNSAGGSESTVAGGADNTASSAAATVGGGSSNTASGETAVVAGGDGNTAGGDYAAVAGGLSNSAAGDYGLAAGRRAKANHDGCFVWGDATNADVTSSAANQFVVRAAGGTTIYSATDLSTGVTLAPGGGSWASVSDRNKKIDFAPVDPRAVLRKVRRVPVTTWRYKTEPGVRHMGPMAQDLHAAFGLGHSDAVICTVDADGVALAAIQGLDQLGRDRDNEITRLRTELNTKAAEVETLRRRLERLESLVDALGQRGTARVETD